MWGMLASPGTWMGAVGDDAVTFCKLEGGDPFRGGDELAQVAGEDDDRATVGGDATSGKTTANIGRRTGI